MTGEEGRGHTHTHTLARSDDIPWAAAKIGAATATAVSEAKEK